jgi:hypothetical protein
MTRCSHKTRDGRVCKNKTCNGLKVCNVHSRECSICFEKTSSGDEVCTLICGHAYHTCCIYPWFQNDHRCPYCRTSVRRPKISLEVDVDIQMTTRLSADIRGILNNLYDNDQLPEGMMRILQMEGRIVLADSRGVEIRSLEVI